MKGVWTTLAITYHLLRFPLLLLYFAPASNRHHSSWSYRQALGNEFLRIFFYHASLIEIRTSETLDPGEEGERFVVIEPARENLYRDILRDPDIVPSVIGGTWYPKVPDKSSDFGQIKVILHFHGGAYVTGDCRTAVCGYGAGILSKATSRLVFCPHYRLASNSNHRFPAALQDAVTAFQYLLDSGIPASNIVLSGDSAGANLVIALLRYIADTNGDLPDPSAALLWCPWVNLAGNMKVYDSHRNSHMDYIPSVYLTWGIRYFVPPSMSTSHPYVSPLLHPFATKTPLWVQVGEKEVLCDDGQMFSERMTEVEGNKVAFYSAPNVTHDIILLGDKMGFEKEAEEAVHQAQLFLEKQTM